MKRQIHSITVDTSALAAARLMKEHQIGFLPVCDEVGHPVGVVTDRDLALRVCSADLPASSTLVGHIMSKNPVHCTAKSSLDRAESLMLKRKTRRVLLLDEQEKLVGLITLADVIHHQDPFKMAHFLRELTEVRLRVEK